MDFWQQEPKFYIKLDNQYKVDEKLYKKQIEHLAAALIVDDYNPHVDIDSCQITALTKFKFPKDALISGSFVMQNVANHIGHATNLKYDDIDIYFKTKADAQQFVNMNLAPGTLYSSHHFDFKNPMCAYGYIGNCKFNLIYGVEYDSPGHLISRFDIRACSMAIDPNTNTLYVVRGSIEDATRKQIVFNPVPRGVSVRRLAKYLKKHFEIEKHQSLFFVELCRSDIYKPELELMTKEY